VTHAVSLLAKALIAHHALKWLRVVVYPEVILEVAHLFENLFAVVNTANEELAPARCGVIGSFNMEILRKGVYRFNSVVGK